MNTKANIIIIEDEKNICNFIETVLSPQGYQVTCANTGTDGLKLIESLKPDVVLLDLGLPDMDGLELIQEVRSTSALPIIVISARTLERSKVAALDLGADDYLTKPFGTAELLARIRTALRHSQRAAGTQSLKYEVGDLLIDFERRLVKVKGQDVHLTQIEYKLVSLLAQNAGKVMTYESIISKIWGPFADSDNQILRVNMAHIRRKLEENPAEPQYIFTEIGVGYRMREEKYPPNPPRKYCPATAPWSGTPLALAENTAAFPYFGSISSVAFTPSFAPSAARRSMAPMSAPSAQASWAFLAPASTASRMVRSPNWHFPRCAIPLAKPARKSASSPGPISPFLPMAFPPSMIPLDIRVPMVDGTRAAIFIPAFMSVFPISPSASLSRISWGKAPNPFCMVSPRSPSPILASISQSSSFFSPKISAAP